MVGDQGEEGVLVGGLGQGAAELADLFADVLVVAALVLGDGLVMAEGGEAVDVQLPFQGREVVVEEGPEDGEILLGEVVHGAFQLPGALGDEAERVFVGHEQEGQVVLPEVFVKAVVRGQVQQTLDLVVEALDQFLPGQAAGLPVLEEGGEAAQDACLL